MKQTERTIKFIAGVNSLVQSGFVKNHTEIIEALEWTKTSFSNVMNGRRNIPGDIYKKFSEVYQTEDTNLENFQTQEIRMVRMTNEVILSIVGELLAIQRGQPVGKVIEDIQEMVNAKLKQGAGKPK